MKNIRSSIYGLFAVLILGFLLSAPQARAETTQCIYCLTGNLATNLSTNVAAIYIDTNNVTIDLNGYKIGNLAAGAGTQAVGIYAPQKKNITIKNGIIRGFYFGIWLDDTSPFTTSSGHLIEDIRADGNTFAGLVAVGTGNVIRNNQVVSTGGSTLTGIAGGIGMVGPGARVINNDVTGTAAQGSDNSAGIYLENADNSIAEGNRISDTLAVSGASTGFYIFGSSNVMVVNNRIATADSGVFYDGSTGENRDNITVGVATPYTGGTDIGNNN
ncbi:MAG: NosD domain-containing protein [Planctomycetota bacterium]|jgi:nitrous oxidase accessory protein NosD